MTMTAESIRKLAGLRISPDQMAGVLEVLADAIAPDEIRRAKQRARTAKHRARRNVTVTLQGVDDPEGWEQRWRDLQTNLLAKRP